MSVRCFFEGVLSNAEGLEMAKFVGFVVDGLGIVAFLCYSMVYDITLRRSLFPVNSLFADPCPGSSK